jgi:membrane protease YdiL (CAAX protease family)
MPRDDQPATDEFEPEAGRMDGERYSVQEKKTFVVMAFMRKRRTELSGAYAGLGAEQIKENVQQPLKDHPRWRRHDQTQAPSSSKKNSGILETHIGRTLSSSRDIVALATVLVVAAVLMDVLICLYRPRHLHAYRVTLAIFGALGLLCLARGDRASIGLVLRPREGFGYWRKATALIGVGLVLFLCLIGVFYRVAHIPPRFVLAPASALRLLPGWCVYYPLLEEVLYRLVLCAPLVALLGPRYAIVISGVVFGGLHWLYGNPAPTNFVAGYILAWAYLRSESVLVPMVWHALGNAAILMFQVGAWYLMQ